MSRSEAALPSIAVIVPAYDAAHHLRRSAPALRALRERATLIIVDAGSTDETAECARELADRVESFDLRVGPAAARNRGAALASEEILLFFDADCVPHVDTVERVARAFAGTPDLVSLTGSYDDEPPESNFASQYMNLRHHYTHQRARREPGSFWAGCGAVRRDAFLAAGGFDAERYPRPAIEDIELATRLQPRGRTRLDPAIQVTHLKRWTLPSVIRTDLFDRCIPWAKLVAETGQMPDDLNLERRQRVAVAVAPFALLSVVGLPIAIATAHLPAVLLGFVCILGSALLHAGLLRFFARRNGVGFALRAWLFHQLHLVYSGVTFAAVLLRERWRAARESTA